MKRGLKSHGLVLKLLPDRFHNSSDTSDPSFKAAINEWSTRTSIPVESIPQPYSSKQSVWDASIVEIIQNSPIFDGTRCTCASGSCKKQNE